MKGPAEPRRYTDMTEEERIEEADRIAVSDWLEEQTKSLPDIRKKQKIRNFKTVLDELLERLSRIEEEIK